MDSELIYEVSIIDRMIIKLEREMKKDDLMKKLDNYKKHYDIYLKQYQEICSEEKDNCRILSLEESKGSALLREISEIEKRLSSAVNMKTMEACEKSLNTARESQKSCEEYQISLLVKDENIKKTKVELYNKLKQIKAKYNSMKKENIERLNLLTEEKNTAILKRQRLMQGVNKFAAEEYEKIKDKKGYGMCEVNRETCSGCGINLPTAIISSVKDKRNLVKCPNCERYLYIIE